MCANISELTVDSKIYAGRNDALVDLNNKSLLELRDLLERQNAILNNKRFLKLLPDKGEKILKFRTKIENEIHHRNEIARSNELMSCLNISGDKNFVEEVEWKRNYHNHLRVDDVENDETDVLKILSESAGLSNCKNENHATSIKLHEKDTSSTEILPEEESSKYPECTKKLIKKTANDKQSPLKKEPFKPHKSTKSEIKNKNHDPGIQTSNLNKPIRFLDLNESIKVEEEYNEKIQEIKIKHAIERLGANYAVHTPEVLTDAKMDENDGASSNQEVELTENLFDEDEQDSEHENSDEENF